MAAENVYWTLVDPVWDLIDIYQSPAVFLETYDSAPSPSRLLFASHFCQSEVCNGGFNQFFYNSTGVLAPEALEGFRAIGQNEIADTLQEAMTAFGPSYVRERESRQEALESVSEEFLNRLDRRFYELIGTEAGGFEAAANRFAIEQTA